MTLGPTDHPGADPVLVLRGVRKTFGSVVALRSGHLELRPGSIHALIGENGAGKSTLGKIVAGLYRRDDGEFLFEGQPVAGWRTWRRGRGVRVPHHHRLGRLPDDDRPQLRQP